MASYETTHKLRANILKALFIIFALLSFSFMYIIYIEQTKSIDNFQNTTQEYIQKTVKYTFNEATNKYTALNTRIIQNLNVAEFVKKNDREGLYKVLKPKFEELQDENPYVHTLHFIKADGTSFLRVHQKDKFGDPIIKDRIMVQEIMKNKETLVGYETGKYGTVFRILMPVFSQGEFLGSLGIGIEPNYLMERIAQIIKVKGALFIKEDKLKLYKLANKFEFMIQGYRLQTKLDANSLNIIKNLPKEYNFENNYHFEFENFQYLLHTIDVKNFKNEVHGKFIFFNDITLEHQHLKYTQLYIALSLIVFIFAAFITVRFLIVKFGNKLDSFYDSIIHKIKSNEEYLKAVEDNSSNIIVTSSPDIKLMNANRRFFEFTGATSIEEFKKEYQCICDLFIPREGYLQKIVDNLDWTEYVFTNPDKIHKAILKKDSKERIFKVTSSIINMNDQVVWVSTFSDITEIEVIRSRLSYAINGTRDGLWDWDLQTNEVYFSPRWKEMLGYDADELPNQLSTWRDRVYPNDLQKALDDLQANHEKKTETYENVHRLRHKNGSWVWILDRGQTIFDDDGNPIRMVGFHTDITKKKEEERLIQLQAKRAEALLELPKFSEILEEREFVQKGQELAENLTQSSIAFIHFVNEDENTIELIAWSKRTLEHYCHVESYDSHYPVEKAGIWADAMRTKKPFVVNDYPNYLQKKGLPEGHAHLQRFISVPVIEHGKVVMITGVGNKNENYDDLDIETVQLISNDIWQTVQGKRNLAEIQQKDKLMLAQSRNAAMGEMISMIAHQWRQPLAVISMSANNVLADIELDMVEMDSLREACNEMIYQTKELSKTIDDFKEFFKPIKQSEMILIKDIFESAFNVIGKSIQNNNIEVIETIENTTEIQTYSRELMQVFINIMNNAKEVLIENKVEKKQLRISIQEKDTFVEVKICDNGGGVPEDIIEKIFEPYFSTKDERTGTGLGLYMSKTIIEKHLGGTLSVHNENGDACFRMELPFMLPKKEKNKDTNG